MLEIPEGVFKLDPSSPSGIAWAVDRMSGRHLNVLKSKAGSPAGSQRKNGRWQVGYAGKDYLCYRIAYTLQHGPVPAGCVIDHVEGCTDAGEIRAVSQAVNSRNSRKRASNRSGTTGVYHAKGHNGRSDCFVAQVWVDHKKTTYSFSVAKYGHDKAKELATKKRAWLVEQANEAGAGFTERHGI